MKSDSRKAAIELPKAEEQSKNSFLKNISVQFKKWTDKAKQFQVNFKIPIGGDK